MILIGTGYVKARAMSVGRGFLETRPQKAAVQFLSEMSRSGSCLWTILVVLHSVSQYYLFMLSFRLPPRGVSGVMGNKLARGVLEAIDMVR